MTATAVATSALTFAWAGLAAGPVWAATTYTDLHGHVVAWGNDAMHQTDVPQSTQYGIVAISAAGRLAMALTWDGKVIAWGDNLYGQANVPAGLSNVVAISAGGSFAVALRSNGSVVAWGDDSWHQTEVPTAAQSGVVAIAAGSNFVVALRKDGGIVAWGDDTNGSTDIPWVTIPKGNLYLHVPLSNLKAVSASGHVLGLKPDGTVVSWGWNKYGQMNVPTNVSGIKAVAAGFKFSLALNSSGTITAWGDNTDGELNTPCSLYNMLAHVCVSPVSGFSAIAAGDEHALALKDGYVRAWGNNSSGQTTVPSYWQDGDFTAVSAGSDFSLGLYDSPGVPFAPAAVNASAGDGVAMVSWAGIDMHGVPIDHLNVTASPGGKTYQFPWNQDQNGWGHGLVSGLTNGTTYTFTVSATNGIGTGPASAATNPVTPMAGKVYSLTVSASPKPAAGSSASAPTASDTESPPSPGSPASAASPIGSAPSTTAPAASSSGSAPPPELAAVATQTGAGSSNAPGSGSSPTNGGGGNTLPLVVAVVVAAGVVLVAGAALSTMFVRRRRKI